MEIETDLPEADNFPARACQVKFDPLSAGNKCYANT